MSDYCPLIGISANMVLDTEGRFPGYHRAYVNDNYVQSILCAGGTPLIIPLHKDPHISDLQVECLDGLILTGGDDINPLIYGEEPLPKLESTLHQRDIFEQQIIKAAAKMNTPIFGICRGMQILNVAFGGTIYQDVSYMGHSQLKHDQISNPELGAHTVYFEEDSFIYNICRKQTVTNSFHHQAIKKVAEGFKVTGRSKDGVIEAIESDDNKPFIIGVQWHPEMMFKRNGEMLDLFKAFIEKVKLNKKESAR